MQPCNSNDLPYTLCCGPDAHRYLQINVARNFNSCSLPPFVVLLSGQKVGSLEMKSGSVSMSHFSSQNARPELPLTGCRRGFDRKKSLVSDFLHDEDIGTVRVVLVVFKFVAVGKLSS